jgi:hypothetical protein
VTRSWGDGRVAWVMVDFIMIATGNFKDKQGLPVKSS